MTASALHHPLDDLAAYAVDAIDDRRERALIETHLHGCVACRGQLAADWAILSGLVADEPPPPHLWGAIAAGTAVPAPKVVVPVDFGEARTRMPEGRARRPARRLVGVAAAAAALVAAVAVGPALVAAIQDAGGPRTSEQADRTLGVLTALDGTEVARVVERGGRTYMAFEAARPLPDGRTFQLWSLDGERPVSLGLLGDGRDTSVAVNLPPGTTRISISDEPDGGSPAPSGPIAGTGTLA